MRISDWSSDVCSSDLFVLDDGVATTELMRIYGASLGLTAKGNIDFDRDAIDLTGVVVPAYSINNFLSKIPLLGTILTGGEGEGLISVVYTVDGPTDDPDVSEIGRATGRESVCQYV